MKEKVSGQERVVLKLVSPKDEAVRDFDVDRPTCSRCGKLMFETQPCHFICSHCGGVHDCSDTASGG